MPSCLQRSAAFRYFALVNLCSLSLIGVLSLRAQAQSDPSAGIQPFSTQLGGIYDSVDIASSNINLIIPIIQKNGKFPFKYQLVGNFHAFPIFNNGSFYYNISAGIVPGEGGGGLAGVPVAADLGVGRFGGVVGARYPTGSDLGVYLTYTISYFTCTLPNGTTGYGELDNNFTLLDATGAAHGVNLSITFDEYPGQAGCGSIVYGIGETYDGSGYQVTASLNGTKSYTTWVYDRSGNEQSAVGVAQDQGLTHGISASTERADPLL